MYYQIVVLIGVECEFVWCDWGKEGADFQHLVSRAEFDKRAGLRVGLKKMCSPSLQGKCSKREPSFVLKGL